LKGIVLGEDDYGRERGKKIERERQKETGRVENKRHRDREG